MAHHPLTIICHRLCGDAATFSYFFGREHDQTPCLSPSSCMSDAFKLLASDAPFLRTTRPCCTLRSSGPDTDRAIGVLLGFRTFISVSPSRGAYSERISAAPLRELERQHYTRHNWKTCLTTTCPTATRKGSPARRGNVGSGHISTG